ncbi:MAG: hypothetical protein ACREMB_01605 [Candidatus Rokuibacteriota bacterium]
MRRRVEVTMVATTAMLLMAAGPAWAGFEITPAIQAELDKQTVTAAAWAASPVIVGAVAEQNRKGPIAGMDNAKWKVTRRSDPVVGAFQNSAAGQFLKKRMVESQGAVSELFLSAARGEKVAFVEKTTSYIHKGAAKFDVPFNTGRAWQGPPEFDESTQTYAIQISVPVLADSRAIGALVVGVNLSYLEQLARR